MIKAPPDIGTDGPNGGGGSPYTPPPASGQGWAVNPTTDLLTFNLAPANGAAIAIKEYASGVNGSWKFAIGSWCPAYGFPSEIEFFSDRLWLAGTPADPQQVWGSQIGDYSNHGRSTPIVDSDSVSFAINARQVNAITDLVPLDKMLVLAKGGEFIMSGGQDDVVTPSTIAIKPQSYLGSGGLQAKVVGDTAVMVQEQGNRVYDIGYRFEADGYRPIDISVWASHLVEAYSFVQFDWAPAPWRVLWFVRDDGTQVACTYMPEQEIIGWSRHDTGRALASALGVDDIEDVVCLPGTKQTEVILLVKRVIDGQEVRYIEQLAPEFVDDIRDWIYCDASLTYDGRNAAGTTLTLTGGTAWNEAEELTLTASSGIFAGTSDVGDGFLFERTLPVTDEATGVTADVVYSVRMRITEYTSATVVKVSSVGTVPTQLRGVASADWVFQRDTISGLDHLEGREVVILTDGSVHPKRVVTDGAIALQEPGGVVTVGLPYRAHIETLELNNPGGATIRDSKKLLTGVGLLVQDSRGIKTCGGVLREDYTYELAQREFEDWGVPTQPLTGYGEVPVSAEWGEDNGHFHILSDDPLPMVVLGLIPKFLTSEKIG